MSNPFSSREKHMEAYEAGMWIFLGTELMLFGGLFLSYLIGRLTYPNEFHQASGHMNLLLGSLNTGILLTSSYTMALAVECSRDKRWKRSFWLLAATAVLGLIFLGIKMFEWHHEITHGRPPGLRFAQGGIGTHMFTWLYFVMTGVHAIHLTIGVLMVWALMFMIRRRRDALELPYPIVLGGLYWHLVDIIWIFLFPCFYLVGGPP